MVDLRVQTSLDQLLLILKISFTFFKTSYFNKEVNYTEPSPSVSIPRLNVGIMNLVMQSVIYNLLREQLLSLFTFCSKEIVNY